MGRKKDIKAIRQGWYPETDEHRHALFKEFKKHTYANCWHQKNHESFLMWEVYGNDEIIKGLLFNQLFSD